jgi:hypothetical protein
VSRWMKTEPNIANRQLVAIWDRFNQALSTKSTPEQRLRGRGAEIARAARTRMISVGVRDDRTLHRFPGIDMEAACGAPQT